MKNRIINVKGGDIAIVSREEQDYISLTDMIKNFGDESILYNWLRNRNTIEFLRIWEPLYNPDFNYGEFAIIKSQAGLNSCKICVNAVLFLGVWEQLNNPEFNSNSLEFDRFRNQAGLGNNSVKKLSAVAGKINE